MQQVGSASWHGISGTWVVSGWHTEAAGRALAAAPWRGGLRAWSLQQAYAARLPCSTSTKRLVPKSPRLTLLTGLSGKTGRIWRPYTSCAEVRDTWRWDVGGQGTGLACGGS